MTSRQDPPGPRGIDPHGGPAYREPSQEEADRLMAEDDDYKSEILTRPVDDAVFRDDAKMTAILMRDHPEMTPEQIQERLRATRAAFEE